MEDAVLVLLAVVVGIYGILRVEEGRAEARSCQAMLRPEPAVGAGVGPAPASPSRTRSWDFALQQERIE
ncbi:MAG: hypothetical protein ACYDA8_11260 [Deferrisomatales bacterium]